MSESAVAVVITCHNYGRFLAECVASVRNQTHAAAELVVVDDASTDDTPAVCAQLGVRYLRVDGVGPHAARGAGFAATTSPWVCFLDADDVLGRSYLADAVSCFAVGVGFVYSDMVRFGALTGRFRAHPTDIDADNNYHAGSVVRRVALEATQVFDTPVPRSVLEDWYAWRAVLRAGWRAVRSRGLYLYRRHGPVGTTRWEQYSYAERADFPRAQVTIAIPLSGRQRCWPRLRDWLEQQSWPSNQTSILLLDSSGDAVFSRMVRKWLAGCQYARVQYIAVQAKPGLADADRHQHAVYRDVQQAMPRLYATLRRAVTTPFVMIVEDDILPPLDAIAKLIMACDPWTPSVSGAYRSRFQKELILWREDGALVDKPGVGVERVGGNGFGCVLFRTSVLQRIPLHHAGSHGDFDRNFYDDLHAYDSRWTPKVHWDVLCDHDGIPVSGTAPAPAVPVVVALPPQAPPARLLDVPACASETRLAVLTTVFSARPTTRPRQNYQRFLAAAEAAGAAVYVIECAVGGADFWVPDRPGLVRVRAQHAGWHKERLLNILERVVPPRFTKLAWIDADILFDDQDWVAQTERVLDKYPVTQLFTEATWLHPDNMTPATSWTGVASGFMRTQQLGPPGAAHPGFAWAMRRDVWRQQDGLFDACATMGADSLMAISWCCRDLGTWPEWQGARARAWAARARRVVAGQVGALPGRIQHLWHGPLRNRQYVHLWERLAAAGWDPDTDLIPDAAYPLQLPYRLARPSIFEPIYTDLFAQRAEDKPGDREDLPEPA